MAKKKKAKMPASHMEMSEAEHQRMMKKMRGKKAKKKR